MKLLATLEHAVEKPVSLCRMCGQCVLHDTGMPCPMTCPKTQAARHALALPGVRGLHLGDFRHDGSIARLCTDLGFHPRDEKDLATDAHRPALTV